MRKEHTKCLRILLWLFKKFVDSGSPKGNPADTHIAEENEIAQWLLILATPVAEGRLS